MAPALSGQNQAQLASTSSKRRLAMQRSSETIGTLAVHWLRPKRSSLTQKNHW